MIFPKFRGDLLAAAATTLGMTAGKVEDTFYPRSPLDVLAQQIVAEVSAGPTTADAMFALARGAAPFADLPRASFDGVLDMLSGRYPSDELAELRPRLTWDRDTGALRPQRAAGAHVVIHDGARIGWVGRTEKTLLTFLPEEGPERGQLATALAGALAALVDQGRRRTLLITEVDGEAATASRLGPRLLAAGFTAMSKGYFKRATLKE